MAMASVQECERAFHGLAAKLSGRDGALLDIRQVDKPDAQVKMTMTSDDLLRLVAGELAMGSAWATGRVKIEASIFDLLKLRSVF